jgi:hypothetical protein
MMSRRKSRRLSSFHHVRLSGWKPPSLLEIPPSPSALHYLKQKPHSSLNSLSVRNDETPCSNPRSGPSGWITFALGVSSWNGLPSETLTPWVKLDLCGWLWWRRRVLAKTRRLEGASAICCLWGFAAGILRITALHSLGMRRLDSESPQHHSGCRCLPKGSFHHDTVAAPNYTVCQWAQTTTTWRQP